MSSPLPLRSGEGPLEVYVIPVARDQYELYVERHTEPASGASGGLFGRIRARFWAFLHDVEQRDEEHAGQPDEPGAIARVKAWVLEWAAQRVAEQRLLWRLRGRTEAVAIHPEDMAFDQVLTLVRRVLQRDYERHRRWLVLDGLAFLFTSIVLGPFFLLIPGVANLPAAYFGFRVVGHCLSLPGARQGLRYVTWSGRPAAPLDTLRDLGAVPAHERDARVHDVAERLQLPQLPRFFERVTARHA